MYMQNADKQNYSTIESINELKLMLFYHINSIAMCKCLIICLCVHKLFPEIRITRWWEVSTSEH